MKFTLPISPDYVAHWGLWEAVREIYQNALDAATDDRECVASIEYREYSQELHIDTSKGHLSPQSLVLGNSSKRDDPAQRGKFGEGYKLALLVLARLGLDVDVFTGTERWIAVIEHDDTFQSDVLNIYVSPYAESNGVSFIIHDVKPFDYAALLANILPSPDDQEQILHAEGQAGRIYVGGLYVSTVKRFKCGYAFRPGTIKLDRDRGMVDGFDLAWQTSKLWTLSGHSALLSELLESEAPDVEYVESHVSEGSELAKKHWNYFMSRHGSQAIPVSSQHEIEQATAAGMTWVLVPEKVKAMLRLVKNYFIPNHDSTLDRLKTFQSRHAYYLTNDGRHELAEIIQSLEKRSEHVEANATH
jgi:hypothetical protein